MEIEILLYIILFFVLFFVLLIRKITSKAFLQMQPKDVSQEELKQLLPKIEKDIKELSNLGFEQFDYFDYSLDQFPLFAYFLKQKNSKTFSGIYLSGKGVGLNKVIFFTTNFENGFSLTSSNHKSTGRVPAIKNYFLQIFTDETLEEVLKRHIEGTAYIMERLQTNTVGIEKEKFRSEFNSKQIEIKKAFGNFIAIKVLLYQLKGHWKNYSRPISEQGVI